MDDSRQQSSQEQFFFWGVLVLVFISRVPFLLPGYGSEEDAWGLAVVAKRVAATGIYEVSRLPGHPLQEFVYAMIWQHGPLAFNGITAVLSAAAIGFFMLTLKKLHVQNYLIAGLVLAFVPVIYINSCNAMDYMWALAFMMAAFYFLISRSLVVTGIMIGLAAGCRITSLAVLLPFAVYLFERDKIAFSMKQIFCMVIFALVVSGLLYLKIYLFYGPAFFDYVAQVPASFSKALFRATVGVWGLIALVDLLIISFIVFRITVKRHDEEKRKLKFMCWTAITVFLISFIILPQKAAFLIPALPFFVLILTISVDKVYLTTFSFSVIFSSFFIGVNLNNDLRGAIPSKWSFSFSVFNESLTIDFLKGPLIAEKEKRNNKIAFAKSVIDNIDAIKNPAVLICGFWISDILGNADSITPNIKLVYFVPEDSLVHFRHQGMQIFYLPEQDAFNDLRYKRSFTQTYGDPFPTK